MRATRARLLPVVCLLALALPAAAQTPAPSPSPSPGWTASLDSGPASVSTTTEQRTYFRARLTVAGPIGRSVRAFLRGDLDRTQDGYDLARLRDTFASIELAAGARWRPSTSTPLSVGAALGVTYSRESGSTGPGDPRLYTAVALACYEVKAEGYACGTFGHRGPAGGLAAGAALSIPVSSGAVDTYLTTDYDFPLSGAYDSRAQTLKAGVMVRVKRISLGF